MSIVTKRTDDTFWNYITKNYKTYVKTLEFAFECDGYVAGGFGRKVYHAISNKTNEIKGKFDCDLFFRDLDGYTKFVTLLPKICDAKLVNSMAEMATNISLYGGNPKFHPDIQAIHAFLGEPEDLISKFDFENCMIGFDNKNVYQSDQFEQVEKDQTLKITNWRKEGFLYRVYKYHYCHGYKKLHSDCQKEFIDFIFELYHEKLKVHKEDKNKIQINSTKFIKQDEVEGIGKFVFYLSNLISQDGFIHCEDLPLFFGIDDFGLGNNYASVFAELRNRCKNNVVIVEPV